MAERGPISVGDRTTIDGIEYAVTRITHSGQRGQIDLITIDEARRRRDSLNDLLEDE